MTIVFATIDLLVGVLFQSQIQNMDWRSGVLAAGLVLALILSGGLALRLVTLTSSQKQTQTRIRTLEQTPPALQKTDLTHATSEEQFHLFLDTLSDVAVIMNGDGTIRYISPSILPMLGYTPEEWVGTSPWPLIYPDGLNATEGAWGFSTEQLLTLRTPITTPPQRVIRKDGTLRWIEASVNAQLDNPQINGIFIIARDITERVQAEQVLRESEYRFRTIADSTPMLIWVAEPDGHNSFNNKWLKDFTGLPEEELEGNNWRQVLHPDDVAGFEVTDHQVLQEHKPFTHEYRLRAADGQYRWMRDNGVPRFSPDGSYLGFIGTVLDINERKDAEAALQEREAQYRSIFESVSDGLEISNPLTRQVIDVNPAMCAMHGYTREEYLNLPNTTFVAPGNPHFTGQYLEEFEESQQTAPADKFIGRSVNVHKDGHYFDVQVAVESFYHNGKLRLLTVVRDITEQVLATHTLEQAVKERTHYLRQLLDVSQAVSSTLDLDSLMQLILEKVHAVAPYTLASIVLIDLPGHLMTSKRIDSNAKVLPDLEWAYKAEDQHINHILTECLPVNIKDVYATEPFALALRAGLIRVMGEVPEQTRSWLGVPMVSEDQAIGILVLDADTPNAFDDQIVERIMPFANHAATAIENSRLKETAVQGAVRSATLAERGRIARELHDSVSQALFGIVLGARTAKEQTERQAAQPVDQAQSNPTAAREADKVILNAINYTLNLAEGALAEMRTLIFELRPESLAQEGLTIALHKQALGLMARQKISVETELDTEPNLPVSNKEAMYRIAVEALQNIIKHSGATHVKLILKQQQQNGGVDEAVVLSIVDNGRGFDPEAFYPGHMGLQSMRERAEQIKSTIVWDSKPGVGTQIKLTVPIQPTRLGSPVPASRPSATSLPGLSVEVIMPDHSSVS